MDKDRPDVSTQFKHNRVLVRNCLNNPLYEGPVLGTSPQDDNAMVLVHDPSEPLD